jgi:hypothetical protein
VRAVRTSQEAHCISATKPNQLMLCGETVAVYCENHTEHTDTRYVQNTQFGMLILVVRINAMCCRVLDPD